MEVTAYSTIVRIISATASRMIGGLEVSRNEEWLESAARYSGDVVQVAVKLRPYPSFVRYLIAPWLKGVRTLEEHLNTARVTFGPIFEKRFAIQQSGEKPDNYEKPVDMVQWMVESAQGIDKDSDVLARNILFMALAGVHTSSGTVIHALFDLCANPEHIEPLREEIEAMVGQHGWSLSALAGCKRLDSFMKESQRLNQTVLSKFLKSMEQTEGEHCHITHLPLRTSSIISHLLTLLLSDLQSQSNQQNHIPGRYCPAGWYLHHTA